MMDWDVKKENWLDAIDKLYLKVDKFIVDKFKKVGYVVSVEKEETKITEDFIGSYTAYNYIVKADNFGFHFSPDGAISSDFKGSVHMAVPWGSGQLILTDKNKWKIVIGMYMIDMKLLNFNEKNVHKIFKENWN